MSLLSTKTVISRYQVVELLERHLNIVAYGKEFILSGGTSPIQE